jgi:hypothetical protein
LCSSIRWIYLGSCPTRALLVVATACRSKCLPQQLLAVAFFLVICAPVDSCSIEVAVLSANRQERIEPDE